MRGIAEWFIYGEVDWEYCIENLKEWGPIVSGALFGAGWWCWMDAVVYQKAVVMEGFPFKYSIPGIVATVALILMNLLSRDQLREASESGEEGADFRARLWLLFTLLVAVGSVAGSVAVLISCAQRQTLVSIGVGSVLQCGFILASALLFWGFRSGGSEGTYGYIGY